MNVLVVDVGGTHVNVLATGQREARKFVSGPAMTAKQMVSGVRKIAGDRSYDVVSIGYPGPVLGGHPIAEPHNLGSGWVRFDLEKHSGVQSRTSMMQPCRRWEVISAAKCFSGLGTGLGSALVVNGAVEPMELSHLPYKKGVFEHYVGVRGLQKYGRRKWRRYVANVVARLIAALEPDDVDLGGGNAKELKEMPSRCRAGDNANAFLGGFRFWGKEHKDGRTRRITHH
jgi:polyphosphate glucokinase